MDRLFSAAAYGVYAVMLIPIVMVTGASLTAGGYLVFPPQGLSLRWWQAMIEDSDMIAGFAISARIALWALTLSVPIGALAAIQLSRLSPNWRTSLSSVFSAPLSVPLVLTGFSLLVFLTQLGLLNETGLIIGHTVVSVPYVLRSALVSTSLADPSLPRSAAIHGASPRQVIWHVTLPMMRPGLISGGLFALLASLNNIVVSAFIAQPGVNPLPVVLFSRMENLAEPSVAAASATVIILTALLCLLLEWRYDLFRSLAGR
ncbi:ABC transporter permease subunit [Bradyrhizobium sp. LHD-71]|uniref:ABC transporter permease n=1 Tax=Bradyrhizobium sp. LHD-71 TaxID=3072141 RepID=UPI0028106951|nr:ABC transporter permease subunit [Bradyrhizobium sp. LHD-71]MDQ8729047.1 ABC transporter permease subunit [Bradyrhizobium sp. LHD-71]